MLKFKAAPTFRAVVSIPVPGDGDPVKIDCEFLHRTRSDLAAWVAEGEKRGDVETILGCVKTWHGIEDPFGREALTELCEAFHAAAPAIVETYLTQLTQARLGNFVRRL